MVFPDMAIDVAVWNIISGHAHVGVNMASWEIPSKWRFINGKIIINGGMDGL
jgi:hypothetical protein